VLWLPPASQVLESPSDLIPRCRRLLTAMRALGLYEHESLVAVRAVDSEADAWPIGVAADLPDVDFSRRVIDDQSSSCQAAWPSVQVACRAVLDLLSRPTRHRSRRAPQWRKRLKVLSAWEFMGQAWVGEAVGFPQWLMPEDSPNSLGSISLDLVDLPESASETILTRLGLALRRGMSALEAEAVLCTCLYTTRFVEDRPSHDFEVGAIDRYSVTCTIHQDDGLIHVVVMPVAVRMRPN
jgi:hypothetical protein